MKTSYMSEHGKPMHDSPVFTMITFHIYHVDIES